MTAELRAIGVSRPRVSWALAGLGLVALIQLGLGASTALAADPVSVSGVELKEEGGATTVLLSLSGPAEGSAVSTFTLSEPLQVVVDIADATAAAGIADLVDLTSLVSKVEVEQITDQGASLTRVRLYLTGAANHKVVSQDGTVRLELTSLDAPVADPMAAALGAAGAEGTSTARTPDSASASASAASAPSLLSGPQQIAASQALASLDFQALDDVSRVVIGTTNGMDYTSAQPRSNLIVVDFPGAFVPQSLTRALDTGEFISPVRLVRAYRTSTGARVAIDLREAAEYTVTRSSTGLIYVDIPVPERMRRERESAEQGYSAVSPDSSEQGIKNAYQQEILIGDKGNTVDPQSAFGSGAGASDPSALVGAAAGFNVDSTSATTGSFTGRRISLDFVNADIHSIFRLISQVSRLNIVSGDDVTGKVTVRMEDVPWDLALAAVLQAKGLGSQRFGNVIRVAPLETIKSEQQAALDAKNAAKQLTDLQLLVLPLNYTSASELGGKVTPLLSDRGKLQTDDTSNQLIIQDTEESLAQIRELVRHLDRQTPQVLIEARIVEANSAYSRSMGIEWGGELDLSSVTGLPTGLFFPNSIGLSGGNDSEGGGIFYSRGQDNLLVDLGPSSSAGSLALSLGSISGLVSIDARLAAMESDGHGKVVSSPRITTLDNQEATISQGQRIPYSSTSSGGTQVQFVEASLDLAVTPHITSDSKVFLDVKISNNRPDFSQLVQGQPAISIKEAETQLLVADGDTAVVGGVYSTEEAYAQTRVPGLSRIPILGYLFKNSDESVSRTEMLVFITPHIVTRAMAESE